MDKVDHKSRDILGGNVEKIAELFPGVITEAKDEATGELKKVVDFDLLRQHLSDELVEGDRERFRLDWPGKKASILKANTPITKTLRPVREDSVVFDATQNIFIEGDNFEVLKVLQESYLGKIKMIYIDPPYNTGKDFIYKDNFAADKGEYEEEIGVRDDENGGKLVKNTETNGRYHSDWLSMMQERLIVARDLLTDDGVIFISIDDNEQANLKALCDEIFGQENFYAMLVIESGEVYGTKASHVDKTFVKVKDYVLVYAKDRAMSALKMPLYDESREVFDTHYSTYLTKTESGILKSSLMDHLKAIEWIHDSFRENKLSFSLINLTQMMKQNNQLKQYIFDVSTSIYADQPYAKKVPEAILVEYGVNIPFEFEDRILFKTSSGTLRMYIPFSDTLKESDEYKAAHTRTTLRGDLWKNFHIDMRNVQDEGAVDYKNGKKPVRLIKNLIKWMNDVDMVVADFFAGSATTGHAVMQSNIEDGGNRKHIQVQLAEPTDPSSEAYKAGYKTIPEISRERIRRAGKKIREDYAEQIAKRDTPLDTGFRAYKLSSSNFIDTAQHPAQTTQASLLDTTDNIKDDRTPEDLLTEVILDLGLTLDLPIEHRDIAGHSVFFVGGNSLVACFDDKVSLDIVDGIAAENPLRIVFKDSSFANDETRINIDIRLKQLSPDTTVQVV